jgi:hypothetical protein
LRDFGLVLYERRHLMSRITLSVTFAAIGAFAVVGAIAHAAIPDPDGVIHGCYTKTNGSLRVIDPSSSRCSPNEVPIAWNQAGRAGPAGPAGPAAPIAPAVPAAAPGLSQAQAPSSAASNTIAYKLVEPIAIGDLAGQNDDRVDHQIVLPFAGRILAIAQVHISSVQPASRPAFCRLLISDGTGPQNGLTAMGQEAIWGWQPAGSAFPFQHTVPVVGETAKPAGTYNVIVQCGLQSPLLNTGMTGQMNKLIVWTAAG